MANRWLTHVLVLAVLVPACSRYVALEPTLEPPPPPPVGLVSEATWVGEWPLTVPEAVLGCVPVGPAAMPAVTLTVGDVVYGVNGTARRTYPGIEPIWKPDPEIPGARVNIGPMIGKGLRICDR
ncbi:hypothetical protein [Mycolicibacterium sp. D5.8-2]|uniref:hypothetical protein n=1 Tax=Mycolicibacterium sp. D5.8-2 TaxID=3085903 RepID=UPI00298D4A2E|nr:hypothetical protein [Mycolicibacterium sp. D5.8-2]MDW5609258.1 hypothetical protein [Mycolicibacterium sp. D5.8-2]